MQLVLSVISKITNIPANDPALLRCAVTIGAPCMMLLVVGRNSPLLNEAFLKTSRAAITNQFYRFVPGGMEAVAKDYAKHP